jgi:integrase
MLGGIYSDQVCPDCGSRFRDDGRRGLLCPNHPDRQATRFRVYFRGVTRRFKEYEKAQRFLTGLRYKTDEETFDKRDYKKDNPLGFANLAEQWLEIKKAAVKHNTYRNLKNDMGKAIDWWGQINIKEIGYAEIEDFLRVQAVSPKTKSNIKSCLHDFWWWLRKRKILLLHQIPEFPEIKFELAFRKTVDKPTQEEILDEIQRISWDINPKIWLGIKFLCTYISIRPGELVKIKESDLDIENGYIIIEQPKEKRPKLVPLLDDDIKLIKSLPRGLPALFFFRHVKGNGAAKPSQRFGKDLFYVWWKRACANLGIEDVDLYGGTRHSSAKALRRYRTPEEIKRATMHSTNKAFERYFQIEGDDLREIYGDASLGKDGKKVAKKKTPSRQAGKGAKLLKFKKK